MNTMLLIKKIKIIFFICLLGQSAFAFNPLLFHDIDNIQEMTNIAELQRVLEIETALLQTSLREMQRKQKFNSNVIKTQESIDSAREFCKTQVQKLQKVCLASAITYFILERPLQTLSIVSSNDPQRHSGVRGAENKFYQQLSNVYALRKRIHSLVELQYPLVEAEGDNMQATAR